MSTLPVLLSIPHGGTRRPAELDNTLCITESDILDDSDPFAARLYDLGERVGRVIKAEIARAFVDLNRSLRDLPPENPDGLIKSSTCHRRPIYLEGMEPDDSLRSLLIERYYLPYHREIQRSVGELDLQLCLDCHTMASAAPAIAPDACGRKRPLFCLSNRNGETSSSEMIGLLASSVSEAFGVDMGDIRLNDPFSGGHITRTYGNNPVPWIQIEMSRSLYLSGPWFDADSGSMDTARLLELNGRFAESLERLFSRL